MVYVDVDGCLGCMQGPSSHGSGVAAVGRLPLPGARGFCYSSPAMFWRTGALIAATLLSLRLSTCRSPGEGGKGPDPAPETPELVELKGVDTSGLRAREKREWSSAVSELLAPCPDQPVSLAACVKESRDCKACAPAAEFLVKQVQKGKTRAQVEAAFKKRFAPSEVKQISLDGSPEKGAPNASVVIVEWADFECPFCARSAPVLDEIVERYPSDAKLVFKNYPLSIHKHAEKAARAAVAAGRQEKFWEMHRALFARHPKPLDPQGIEEAAKVAKLDLRRFRDELDSEPVADAVAKDRKQGDALKLEGTPLIYVNGRHFDLDYFDIGEDLEDWIVLEVFLATGKEPVAKPKAAPAPKASATPEPSE